MSGLGETLDVTLLVARARRGVGAQLQWRDVLGRLRIGRGRLDEAYLADWSRRLGVDDLLARAKAQLVAPAD